MDNVTVGLLGFAVLIILVLARMPVGAALALVGSVGFASIVGWKSMLDMLQVVPYSTFASGGGAFWPLLFMLLALCFMSDMARDLLRSLACWLPGKRLGPPLAALLASAFLSALAVFGLAGIKQLSALVYGDLRRQRYSDRFITAMLAGGLSLGILVPPGVFLVIYGVITENSIGSMFLACVVPLLLSLAVYVAIIIMVYAKTDHGVAVGVRSGQKSGLTVLAHSWDIWFIVIVLFGGIFFGLLTRLEATSLCVVLAFVFTVWRGKMSVHAYFDAGKETLVNTGWIFMLILGAMIFGYFLTITRLPYAMSEFFFGLGFGLSPYIMLIVVLLMFVLAGIFFDGIVTLLLLVPVLFPLTMRFGADPLWFGFLAVRCIGMGISLPGLGICLRRVCRASGVEAREIKWANWPFFVADVVLLALMIIFPGIVTWLPNAVLG